MVKIIFFFSYCFIRISKTTMLMDYAYTNLELCDFTIYSNSFVFLCLSMEGFAGNSCFVAKILWHLFNSEEFIFC